MNKIKFNYNLFLKLFIIVSFGLGFGGCDNKKSAIKNSENYLISVEYVEQEQGIEPYKVRLIVSNKFLRIDDGGISDGFILFNRLNNIIYNINNDDNTIMEIKSQRKKMESPIKLQNEDKRIAELVDAPKLNNTVPVEYELKTNGAVCLKMIVVEKLLPNVEQALRSFKLALADDSTTTLASIPMDMLNPCDLSMNTFHSTRYLKYGFPIQVWNDNGYSRSLVSYEQNFKSDVDLFKLPKDYRQFSIDELRMGK